jgi:hypothetical protein
MARIEKIPPANEKMIPIIEKVATGGIPLIVKFEAPVMSAFREPVANGREATAHWIESCLDRKQKLQKFSVRLKRLIPKLDRTLSIYS